MNNINDIFTEAYINIIIEDAAKEAEVESVKVQNIQVFAKDTESEKNLSSLKALENQKNTSISALCKILKTKLNGLKLNAKDLISNQGQNQKEQPKEGDKDQKDQKGQKQKDLTVTMDNQPQK